VKNVLDLWLESKSGANGFQQFDHLDIIVTIDHGKGHSWIMCNLITHTSLEDGEWQEEEYAVTIGNARCCEGNANIIMNTFGTQLHDDLKMLPTSISILGGKAEFRVNTASEKNITINLFMASDILFYNMVIGKEGMSGWWCSYCQLFKNDWQQLHHQHG
jgi:hypothetical protein